MTKRQTWSTQVHLESVLYVCTYAKLYTCTSNPKLILLSYRTNYRHVLTIYNLVLCIRWCALWACLPWYCIMCHQAHGHTMSVNSFALCRQWHQECSTVIEFDTKNRQKICFLAHLCKNFSRSGFILEIIYTCGSFVCHSMDVPGAVATTSVTFIASTDIDAARTHVHTFTKYAKFV